MGNNSRRTFLGVCLAGLSAVIAVVAGWPIIKYLSPLDKTEKEKKLVIPEKDLVEGAKFLEFAGSAAVLIRKKGGGVMAFSAVCTHLGCIVQWENDIQSFLCPCHAGRFNDEGIVIAGPPPKPLPKIPVTVANGLITVG
jgi:cytochrome b6-f complex iron-sulfur subunit